MTNSFLRTGSGASIRFNKEEVIKPLFTAYDEELCIALLKDWCSIVVKQRDLVGSCENFISEVRAVESELMFLTSATTADASKVAAQAEEREIGAAVKEKYDAMYKGLQEMCMCETGTR